MTEIDEHLERVVCSLGMNGCGACTVVSRSEAHMYLEAVVRVRDLLLKVGWDRGVYFAEVSSIAVPAMFHQLGDVEVALGWANPLAFPISTSHPEGQSLDELTQRICTRLDQMNDALSGERAADVFIAIVRVATDRGKAIMSRLRGGR